jgi:4-amino-4-deoxy-L-arabinose transferase-like glycosyltransferase
LRLQQTETLEKIKENIVWIVAETLVVSAWLAGLFIDTTGDSGLYSAIVRQMVESGDWFNLKINGQPYDQKPHLFFWLAGIGVKLFGNTNFAFKLFPFLYGLLGIYLTYRLGRQLFSEQAGRFAALVAGTSQIFFLYFFDMHTDLVLQTGVTLALWQLAAYFQSKKPMNFVLAFVGVGLAMLSKGPVGAVLPFLTVLIYLIAGKNFRQLFHPKWLLGILIVLVLISPSLLHLYKSFGVSGLKFYFIGNNIGRITGEVAGSSNDYIFYLHTFLWAFLPWTPVVILALVKMVKTRMSGFTHKSIAIGLIGSVLILLLILSIAKGKAPNYFLITVAPFSVFAGWWLAEFIRLKGPKFSRVMAFTVVFFASLNLYLNASFFPELAKYQGGRQAINLFETHKKPGDKLYNFVLEDYNLFFYSAEPVENIETWEEFYEVAATKGAWIYTHETKVNDMLSMPFKTDTVYQIRQRGMNEINLKFLNPSTRTQALKTNYLVVIGE